MLHNPMFAVTVNLKTSFEWALVFVVTAVQVNCDGLPPPIQMDPKRMLIQVIDKLPNELPQSERKNVPWMLPGYSLMLKVRFASYAFFGEN